jgi:hypothetical protein
MSIALQLRLCGKNINFVVALLLATPTELGIYASLGENRGTQREKSYKQGRIAPSIL